MKLGLNPTGVIDVPRPGKEMISFPVCTEAPLKTKRAAKDRPKMTTKEIVPN